MSCIGGGLGEQIVGSLLKVPVPIVVRSWKELTKEGGSGELGFSFGFD